MNLTAWSRLYPYASTSRLHPGGTSTGKLPPELQVEQLPNGRYYGVVPPANDGRCVLYARVSSNDRKADRDRQVGRVVEWAKAQGPRPDEVVREIGSGVNGNRRGLRRLVEHRERLCRFGFEYLEAALGGRGPRVVLMDGNEVDDDLVMDVTEVMTSLCARLYGRCSARRRARGPSRLLVGHDSRLPDGDFNLSGHLPGRRGRRPCRIRRALRPGPEKTVLWRRGWSCLRRDEKGLPPAVPNTGQDVQLYPGLPWWQDCSHPGVHVSPPGRPGTKYRPNSWTDLAGHIPGRMARSRSEAPEVA